MDSVSMSCRRKGVLLQWPSEGIANINLSLLSSCSKQEGE